MFITRHRGALDGTAVIASRIMAVGVGALSLAVGVFTVAKLALPRVDAWADGREMQLGASGAIVAFAASVVAARLRLERRTAR